MPTVRNFTVRALTYNSNKNKASTLAAKKQLLDSHLLPTFGHLLTMRYAHLSPDVKKDAVRALEG